MGPREHMKTFSAKDWHASLEEWDAGRFSDEWKPFRHLAAMRGILFPPTGSRHDSWEDPEPSQRAILWRAVSETPKLLAEAIDRARSWREVLDYVLARRDEWRAELDQRERELARLKEREANPREAVLSLRQIMDRIVES